MARPSILDRALGAVGLARKTGKRSVFAGAKIGHSTQDWFAAVLSADQAIKGDLRRLRDRSRSLVRDFSYASRFVQAVAENVAGPDGATLQVRVAKASGDFKATLNDTIEEAWAEWCEDPTVQGRLSFTDLEHLLCEALPQDGAFLVRMVPGYQGNKFRFALEVLDPDQLDHEYDAAAGTNRNEVRQGVEVDAWGRPVAYHLWTVHPTDYGRGTRERRRVSADEIIHGYMQRRPGQTHGIPWFAPVLINERMLAGFEEGAVTAARVGAAAAWSIETDGQNVAGEEIPAEYTLEAEPGQGMVMPQGYKMNWNDPTFPNEAIDPFCRYILQSIATGLRVSHLTLTGDLRGANYSSMRAGLLPERDAWHTLFGWFTRTLHRRVYRAWLKSAVLHGAVAVPPRELAKAIRADQWQQRGFWSVDPGKELEAAQMEVAMGINSRSRLAAGRGVDFETILMEQHREQELAASYGVTLGADQYAEATKTDTPPSAGASDGEDPADGASDAATDDGDRARRLRLARRIG